MSLNYRAFQPGLSSSVMAYSQPALWSRLLFLIAGFRNNCPAPFKKRQLDNDLVQKAYLSVTEPGTDQALFACQVTAVSVIISMCWRDWQHTQGCPSPALPCPGHSWALVWDAPSWGFSWCLSSRAEGWVQSLTHLRGNALWSSSGKGHSWRSTPENLARRMVKGLGKAALTCVSAAGVFLGCFLTALFYLKGMTAAWIWCKAHWRWRKG